MSAPSAHSEDGFLSFIFYHLYLYANAAEAADPIIDVNRRTIDADYSRSIEHNIPAVSGVALDLSSASAAIAFSLVDAGPPDILAGKLAVMAEEAARQGARTEVGRVFIDKAVADLLAEYGRWRFYIQREPKAAMTPSPAR